MKQGYLFWGGYVCFILLLGMLLTRVIPEPPTEAPQSVAKDSLATTPITHDTIHDTVCFEPEIVFVTDTVYIREPFTRKQIFDDYRNVRLIQRYKSNPTLHDGNS